MSANGISTLPNKQARQLAKLDIAQAKRKGYSAVVENTTAYSWPTNFSVGDIKITVNNVDDVYLHFYNSVPAISDLITVGMRVTIDWDGRPGNTVADIASTLIDFPGHAWRPGGLGFLLSIVTTTELPGNSEDYNIEGLHIPNGRFSGSGSPDTSAPFYRIGNEYDITELPTQYTGNSLTDHINETGLIYGRPWVQFLPSDLFAAGEEGAWFDPGDIATLFQDTAGTVPVTTAGQSVALMKDKSGRGHDASQSTAGYRPTWQIDPYGYGYLLFDGVNDYMVTSNIDLTGTAKVTASVGLLVDDTNRSAGIRKVTYSGDWNGTVSFFNTATSTGSSVATNFTIASESTNTSEQYFGVFLADYTGTWTFALSSDDKAALWIGDTAGFGYTSGNALVTTNNNSASGTISLVAGQYYPIRVMYGNGPSAGTLGLTYAHTGQSATSDYTGKLFYDPAGVAICTGGDPATVNGTFLIGAPSSAADHSFYLRGTSTIQARVQNVVAGDDILTGVFDISQATKELELVPRLSGTTETDISWIGTNAGTGNFGNQPLYIGALGGSGVYFKGHIYGIVVRGALSNNTQITSTEAWINRKLD